MMDPVPASVTSPASAPQSLVGWMRETALPCWADHGFDPKHDRFHEALDGNARPLDLPRRAMVQARQIYVYAHAALLGWHHHGRELAERAAVSLLRDHGVPQDERLAIAFSVDRQGTIVSHRFDSYTHAFVLFALAWLYRLTGDGSMLDAVRRINAFVTSELIDPEHGGLFDTAARHGPKRQNPVMHLVEAYLALEAAAPGQGYLRYAETLLILLARRLIRNGLIVEDFAENWHEEANAASGRRWEPGHHYEWAWLLEWHAALVGAERPARSAELCSIAGRHGHAPSGLIYDALSCDLTVTGGAHRLWPHTEAVKAGLAGHRGNEKTPHALVVSMVDKLITRFVGRPFPGGWIDRIDPAGAPLVQHVPASSLYHLMLAATEIDSKMPDRYRSRSSA